MESNVNNNYQYFVKADKNINNAYYIGAEQNGKWGQSKSYTTSWQRLSKTFVPTTNATATAFYVVATSDLSVGDSFYIYGLSIEGGDNSNNIEIVNMQPNTEIGNMPVLKRNGYTFNGWYTDPVYGTQVTSSTTVPNSDITYYAHWTKNNE